MNSLQEKLSAKTKSIKEREEQKQKEKIDEGLRLVRRHICDLEERQQKLIILHESLIAKKMNGGGIGMKEYAQRVAHLGETETERINKLMQENRQALEAMGIKNRDELVRHPEFSQTEEVGDYQESLKNAAGLAETDDALLRRFTELGIDSNQERLSKPVSKSIVNYELLATVLANELTKVEQEVVIEKMKTPDGRQEIIDQRVEKIVPQLPVFSFDCDIDKNYYINGWVKPGNNIYFGERSAKSNVNLRAGGAVPKNLKEMMTFIDAQLLSEILETAYRYKFDQAVEKFDQRHEKWRGLQKQITQEQLLLPELKRQYEKFSELQKTVRETLQEKSLELERAGINFDPINIMGYGGKYSSLIDLHRFREKADIISEIVTTDKLPVDRLTNIQDYLIAKIANLQGLLDKIRSLSSSADIQFFLSDKVRGVASIHRGFLECENFLNNSHNRDYEDIINKYFQKKPTFKEVKKFVDERVGEQNMAKEEMLEQIMRFVKIELKQNELDQLLDKNRISIAAKYNMETYLSNLEHTKQNARQALIDIQNVKNKLPENEELILRGSHLNIPSVEIKVKTLCQRQDELRKELHETLNDLEKHRQQKPKLFGVKAWENKLSKLLEDKKVKENNLSAQELLIAEQREHLSFDIYGQEYYLIKDLLKKTETRGKREEVFFDLISELNAIIDQQVPSDVLSVFFELQELKKRVANIN